VRKDRGKRTAKSARFFDVWRRCKQRDDSPEVGICKEERVRNVLDHVLRSEESREGKKLTRSSVVPSYRRLLLLDERSRRPLRVELEDLLHLAHPSHVQLIRQRSPLRSSRSSNEAPMLGRKSQVLHASPVLEEEGIVSTRDEVDDVPRILSELGDGFEGKRSGDGVGGVLDDGSEGSLETRRKSARARFDDDIELHRQREARRERKSRLTS